jgi:hypothetical protein
MDGPLGEAAGYPPARTDVGSEFNAWRNATVSLYVVLILTLIAAPGAMIGMGMSYALWKVAKPTWITIGIMGVSGVITVAVFAASVLWWWPWGAMLPDRLFAMLPPGSALPYGPAVENSMVIEACLGPGLAVVLSALRVISKRTLTAGIAHQARGGSRGGVSWVHSLTDRYSLGVAPLPAVLFNDKTHPAHGIRLGANKDNRRQPFDLDVSELRLHTFLPGASGSGKTTTLARIADGALGAGYGAVVLDMKGGGLRYAADKLATTHGLPFVLVDALDPKTVGYNPATGTPSDITNKLVGSFTFGEAGEIYKQIAMAAMPVIIRGLLATDTPVSLKTIADACDENAVRLLARKVEGDGSDPAMVALADELNGLFASGDAAVKSGIGSLKFRLGALLQGSFAPLFTAKTTLDWDALTSKRTVVYVSLPTTAASEDVDLMGRVLLQDLKQVCSRRLRITGAGGTVLPVLVAIDEFAGLGEPKQIVDLLLQARQAEMPLLLATQKIPDDPLLKNSCLQAGLLIVHRLAAQESQDMADQFGTRATWKVTQQIDWESGTSQKGSVRDVQAYVVNPDELRRLATGEAAVRSVPTARHAIVIVIPTT